MTDSGRPLRVLVFEGSSTSAREAITILGLLGHTVEDLRSLAVAPFPVLVADPEISSLPRIAG